MNWEQISGWVGSIVAVLAALGTFTWWLAKLYGKICTIEAGIHNVTAWVRDLRDGKGPICAGHRQRLDDHERELCRHDEILEDHGRRLTTVEQRAARRKAG